MDLELMTFYQTYIRFCHLHKERMETFKKAKVSHTMQTAVVACPLTRVTGC